MDSWLWLLPTLIVAPVVMTASGWLVWRSGRLVGSGPSRWGLWLGGSLALLVATLFALGEAAATGAHPITLAIQGMATAIFLPTGMVIGGAAGTVAGWVARLLRQAS